jgi:hypothetical protein
VISTIIPKYGKGLRKENFGIKKGTVMYNDGIENGFEEAHQKGLRRGFDLGWSYKGRFDREIISETIARYKDKQSKIKTKGKMYHAYQFKITALAEILQELKRHSANRENISINSR